MNNTVKKLLLMATILFVFAFDAAATPYTARLGAKLGNGIANAATGIAEIPKGVMVANREQGPAYAATAGFVTGMVHMLGRTLCGAYDLVTFMIPTKPIITPDYVWQDFDRGTSYRSTWEFRK